MLANGTLLTSLTNIITPPYLFRSELQTELNAAAVGLNTASSDVVQNVERPAALASTSAHFGDAFNRLLGVSMEMAGHTEVRVKEIAEQAGIVRKDPPTKRNLCSVGNCPITAGLTRPPV